MLKKSVRILVVVLTACFMFVGTLLLIGCVFQDKPNQQVSKENSNQITGQDDVKKYEGFIGLSKNEFLGAIGETPIQIDEGGLEFKNEGIRVWFEDNGNGPIVSQIWTQRKDLSFNGAKIGDKIDKFKEALGSQISDNKSGDMHFKYDDIFLAVNYATETDKTIAVYFLKEDF